MSDWEDDTHVSQQNFIQNTDFNALNSNYYQQNGGKSNNFKRKPYIHDKEENEKAEVLEIPSDKVKFVIGRAGAKIKDIQSSNNVHLQIDKTENSNGMINVTVSGNADNIQSAMNMIHECINYVPASSGTSHSRNTSGRTYSRPDDRFGNSTSNYNSYDKGGYTNNDLTSSLTSSRPDDRFGNSTSNYKSNDRGGYTNNDFYSSNVGTSTNDETIDWDALNRDYEKAQMERWSKFPPVIKDFYKEDENVANMSPEEIEQFRTASNHITVARLMETGSTEELPIPNPVMSFEQCFVDYPDLLEEIKKNGFSKPSPIQSQSWPVLLKGQDLIGIAQTGTGKTLAFLLPAMIHTENQTTPRSERTGPNVLVLAPTRELAIQIQHEVLKYNFRGMNAVCLYGGGDRSAQIKKFNSGVEIVIATPGRLNDLIAAKIFDVSSVTYLVLDEADRMLDMGFESQIRKVLCDIRPDRQTVMTSATWPSSVQRLAKSFLKNPVQVNVGSLDLTAVHSVKQIIEIIDDSDKFKRVLEFIKHMLDTDKIIIFCGRKVRADDLSCDMILRGISCQLIHGDRDQMDREQAIADIKSGLTRILIATDVASRGLDIEDISHVINFDFPRNIEEYVHRVGRTGRAGKTGISLSFITREDWGSAADLIKILQEADQEYPNELNMMAERFQAMKQRQNDERARFGGRGGGGGGGFGGGRGRNRGGWASHY